MTNQRPRSSNKAITGIACCVSLAGLGFVLGPTLFLAVYSVVEAPPTLVLASGDEAPPLHNLRTTNNRRMLFGFKDPKTVELKSMEAELDQKLISSNIGGLDAAVAASDYSDPSSVPPFQSAAKKCSAAETIPKDLFKSQSSEDRKLMHWFESLCEGTYIEMGALDGVLYSNSYVFNKALDWKGVLIELTPGNYEKLVANRPIEREQAVINAGVCAERRTLHYVSPGGQYRAATSAIYEFVAQSFADLWWEGISLDDPKYVTEIECDTLDSLLLTHTPDERYWDFFSLDVEGAEFSVLQSIDFRRVGFGIIFVEADDHNELKNLAIVQFLLDNGYRFLEEAERSYWFVNQNFHSIYEHLIH